MIPMTPTTSMNWWPCPPKHPVQHRCEVIVPVDEQVKELVQPGEDRGRDETDVQQAICLINRIMKSGRSARRATGHMGGKYCLGIWAPCKSKSTILFIGRISQQNY